jgi:hypothetical protein
MSADKAILLLSLALVGSNVAWWVLVRGMHGVISDLNNIRADAKNLSDKVRK